MVKKALFIGVAINIADMSCSLIPPISNPEFNLVEMQGQNRDFGTYQHFQRAPKKLLTIKVIIVNIVHTLNSSAFADFQAKY